MNLYEGKIQTMHGLPYSIHSDGNTYITEKDIVKCLFGGDEKLYEKHFKNEVYVSGGNYKLLDVLKNAYQVYEVLSDKEGLECNEVNVLNRLYPYILQLAKIGASELGGDRKPLDVMESMIIGGDTL